MHESMRVCQMDMITSRRELATLYNTNVLCCSCHFFSLFLPFSFFPSFPFFGSSFSVGCTCSLLTRVVNTRAVYCILFYPEHSYLSKNILVFCFWFTRSGTNPYRKNVHCSLSFMFITKTNHNALVVYIVLYVFGPISIRLGLFLRTAPKHPLWTAVTITPISKVHLCSYTECVWFTYVVVGVMG